MMKSKYGKKTLALLLMAALTFGFVTAAYADNISVEPAILNGLDMTASEFYSSDANRVLFTVAVILDGGVVWSEIEARIAAEAMVYDTIYMVKDGLNVLAMFFGENNLIIFNYDSLAESAQYNVTQINGASDDAAMYMRELKNEGVFSEYSKVDGEATIELFNSVKE